MTVVMTIFSGTLFSTRKRNVITARKPINQNIFLFTGSFSRRDHENMNEFRCTNRHEGVLTHKSTGHISLSKLLTPRPRPQNEGWRLLFLDTQLLFKSVYREAVVQRD